MNEENNNTARSAEVKVPTTCFLLTRRNARKRGSEMLTMNGLALTLAKEWLRK